MQFAQNIKERFIRLIHKHELSAQRRFYEIVRNAAQKTRNLAYPVTAKTNWWWPVDTLWSIQHWAQDRRTQVQVVMFERGFM